MPKGEPQGHYPKQACKYCGEQISVNSIARHENGTSRQKACKDMTDAERLVAKQNRNSAAARADRQPAISQAEERQVRAELRAQALKKQEQRAYYRNYAARRKANDGKPLKLAKETERARQLLNSNGKITFTVSVDRATLLTLLAKLSQTGSELVSIIPESDE